MASKEGWSLVKESYTGEWEGKVSTTKKCPKKEWYFNRVDLI